MRYADDIAIYASSQRSAERIKESVIRWLSKELKLEVNRAKSGAGPTEQSGLLGFRIDQQGNIEIGDKAIQRLKKRVRELWDALQGKTSEELRDQWRQYISGWWNYFQLAENRRDIERLSGWIRRHIRKCFWQRWHGSQGRQKALQKLGISGPTLSLAKCTRGAWRMAAHHVMQKALSNRTLQPSSFPGRTRRRTDRCQVQPPDAENGMSGGVGGARCAITATRPDNRTRPSSSLWWLRSYSAIWGQSPAF